MTCIACKIEPKEIHLASDSQVTLGNTKMYFSNTENSVDTKIFKINKMLMACCGDLNQIQSMYLFMAKEKPVIHNYRDAICLTSRIKKSLKDNYNTELNQSFSMIIISNKKAFAFDAGCVVKEITDYWSIGSGSIPSLVAMSLGKSAKESVNVAKQFDIYCGGDTILKTIKK
jgi:ATP-dependent protease HslVU (ClpYQ) peptidase subunit